MAANGVFTLTLNAAFALGFVLFLVTVDAWTTHLLLSNGLGWEFNPLMRHVYQAGGVAALLGIKLVFTGVCLWWVHRRFSYTYARLASVASSTPAIASSRVCAPSFA